MSGRQMEGDNQRRRALGRQARQRGHEPSQAGVTLGASKQVEHRDDKRRDGPPAAGNHKPVPGDGGTAVPPAGQAAPTTTGAGPTPTSAGPTPTGVTRTGYQELITTIAERSGVEFAQARAAAEATVGVLAAMLVGPQRERLRSAVPVQLRETMPMGGRPRGGDLASFLGEISWLLGQSPERARYQAQATLTALAERDPDLVRSLDVPRELVELFGPGTTAR